MTGQRVFVIAEAGVNHNGDPAMAMRLIEAAVEAGADAVKFQSFTAARLVSPAAPKARYQQATTAESESQFEMLRKLELTAAQQRALAAHCGTRGIEFMSTPFDEQAVAFLSQDVGVQRLKVASGEITNGPLLLAVARCGLPVILSTGMSTLDEVRAALGVLAFGFTAAPDVRPSAEAFAQAYESEAGRRALDGKVTLLHCTSEYPAPHDEANLRAMATLREAFGLPVGLSDHSIGPLVPLAAAALGAGVIEKHLTLDRGLPGPDHLASTAPADFAEMVAGIRTVEAALGSPDKRPTASELANRAVARRSLVALSPIRAGETFDESNLAARRPGTGATPLRYWDLLGTRAARDYAAGEAIEA